MTAHAPSNGTMGELWREQWCYGCALDHGFSHVDESEQRAEDGCPWLLRMMVERGPFDFLLDRHTANDSAWSPAKLECRMFDRCGCDDEGGEGPTQPVPVHPDQGLLFDMLEDSPVTPGGVVLDIDTHDTAQVPA